MFGNYEKNRAILKGASKNKDNKHIKRRQTLTKKIVQRKKKS